VTLHPQAKRSLLTGSILLALAVLIGAFGAHGLKSMVEADKLVTFETGVRYHFYHGLGLLFLGILQLLYKTLRLDVTYFAFTFGTLLFSFNCYLYVLTGIKTMAMIVPLGGLLFVLGWIYLSAKLLKA
jgi:uncharacterized membrane protein YgdD (TMEM256/DUF423 family)